MTLTRFVVVEQPVPERIVDTAPEARTLADRLSAEHGRPFIVAQVVEYQTESA